MLLPIEQTVYNHQLYHNNTCLLILIIFFYLSGIKKKSNVVYLHKHQKAYSLYYEESLFENKVALSQDHAII